jgi:hypothetical protein
MTKVLFPNIRWWFLLLVPVTFLGFYPSYFSKLSDTLSVFHFHAIFMIVWIAIAITQPFLIRQKKIELHQRIGKISYVIMPLVFITAFLVIRHVYHNFIHDETEKVVGSISKLDEAEVNAKAAAYVMIGVVYLVWLIIFYFMAILNRKRKLFHATYMFAAVLTFLGPTVDRILYQVYQYLGIEFNLLAETAVFISIDLLLAGLIWYQWKKGYSVKAAFFSLFIYVSGQAAYFIVPKMEMWSLFLEFML